MNSSFITSMPDLKDESVMLGHYQYIPKKQFSPVSGTTCKAVDLASFWLVNKGNGATNHLKTNESFCLLFKGHTHTHARNMCNFAYV